MSLTPTVHERIAGAGVKAAGCLAQYRNITDATDVQLQRLSLKGVQTKLDEMGVRAARRDRLRPCLAGEKSAHGS